MFDGRPRSVPSSATASGSLLRKLITSTATSLCLLPLNTDQYIEARAHCALGSPGYATTPSSSLVFFFRSGIWLTQTQEVADLPVTTSCLVMSLELPSWMTSGVGVAPRSRAPFHSSNHFVTSSAVKPSSLPLYRSLPCWRSHTQSAL